MFRRPPAFLIVLLVLVSIPTPASASPGELDLTFGGGDGFVDYAPMTHEFPSDIASSNGYIATSGVVSEPSPNSMITRTTATGVPDSGFDGDGMLVADLSGAGRADSLESVVIDSSGRILAAGSVTESDMVSRIFVTRILANASPDPTFDGDGIAVLATTKDSYGRAIQIQKDGKIVVAGVTDVFDKPKILVARYTANGQLDERFSGDGVATTSFKGQTDLRADDMAIARRTGVITVVGGVELSSGAEASAVVQFRSDGSLNTSFSGDGKWSKDLNLGQGEWFSGVLAQGKKVVASGGANAESTDVVRLLPGGGLDDSFSGNGIFSIDEATGGSNGEDIVKAPGGGYAVASIADGGPDADAAGLIRLTNSGQLDPGFDIDGLIAYLPGTADGRPAALTTDGAGILMVMSSNHNVTGVDTTILRIQA